MATSTDSIYVNIIAKTQDAVKGINDLLRAVTLTGAGMFAFRQAARLMGDAIRVLRSENKELDTAVKGAETGFKDLISFALQPLVKDLTNASNKFAELAERITGAKKAAEEYAAFQQRVAKGVLLLTGTPLEIAQAETAEAKAMRDRAAIAYQTAKEDYEAAIAKLQKDYPMIKDRKGLENILRAGRTGIEARVAETGAEYNVAQAAYAKYQKIEESIRNPPKGLDYSIVFSDFDTNILEQIQALKDEDSPLIQAMFWDWDEGILREIQALKDEDDPLIKYGFSDDDKRVLEDIKQLMTEDAKEFTAQMQTFASYMTQAAGAFGQFIATGDVESFIQAMNSMLASVAMLAAGRAGGEGKWGLMAFWLGVAGVSAFAGGLMSGSAAQNQPDYSQYPVYSGGGKSITIVNNVQGSVVTERQLAVSNAKHMSRW